MYREILKTADFQVKRIGLLRSIAIAVCLNGWLFVADGASTAVSVKADTAIASPAEVRAGAAGPDKLLAAVESGQPGAQASPPITPGRIDSQQSDTRWKTISPRANGRQQFIGIASAISREFGKKVSGPLERIAGFKVHLKKILFLAGSIVIVLITLQFYQNRREQGRFMTTTRLSIMDKEVQRACRYIEEHYDDPALDLHGICTALVTGAAFLDALFIKELGLTVDDFIAQVRVNRAKIALRKNPGIPVDVLARSVGFSDQEVFTGRFETVTGMSCQKYRDAVAQGSDAAA